MLLKRRLNQGTNVLPGCSASDESDSAESVMPFNDDGDESVWENSNECDSMESIAVSDDGDDARVCVVETDDSPMGIHPTVGREVSYDAFLDLSAAFQ